MSLFRSMNPFRYAPPITRRLLWMSVIAFFVLISIEVVRAFILWPRRQAMMNEIDSQSLLSVLSRCSSAYIFVLVLGIGLPLVRRIARKAFEESNVLTCGVCNHNL